MRALLCQSLNDPVLSCFSVAELQTQVDSAQVVSFDFFDTLFLRPLCDPEDIFDLLGERLAIKNFRHLRRAAQAEAFRRMQKAGRGEITLADIYECFEPQEVSTQELLQAEYELELSLVRPNPELTGIYQNALQAGKTVIIVSDMYLPRRFFEETLSTYQFDPVPLFISSEYNATKRDHGELFDLVASELGVPHQQMLHIGDNPVGDVERARNKGLQAFHYRESRLPEKLSGAPFAASLAHGLLRTNGHTLLPESKRELGFLYGGPAAVGFLNWISEQARDDSIDHILFLARDGYVLNSIARSDGAPDLPRYHYLLGSRVVFMLAAINSTNFHQYLPELLLGADGLSPYELLERIGVPVPASHVMSDLGLDDDSIVTPKHYERLARFLSGWRGQILQVCRRNRQALFSYLKSMGVQSGERVAIVDIGWNGTTQETFERAIQPMMDLDVHGYYFCLADTEERLRRQVSHKMKALFSSPSVSTDLISQIYENRVAVELFFSAPHDAVIGLRCTDDLTIAVEDQGRAQVGQLSEIVSEILSGMIAFAPIYYAEKNRLGLRSSGLNESWPLVDLVTTEKWKKQSIFEKIKNFDAWGSSGNHDMFLHDYVK